MAIIFTMYNISRAMSILGVKGLIERLKQWKLDYKAYQSGILKSFDLCQPKGYYRSIKTEDTRCVIEADKKETGLHRII